MDGWELVSLLDNWAESVGVEKRSLRKHFGDQYDQELTDFVYNHADEVCQLATVDMDGVGGDFRNAVSESRKAGDSFRLFSRASYPDVFLYRGKKVLLYRDKLLRIGDRKVTAERASDIWTDVLPNDLHNEGGVTLPKGKKPESLLARIIQLGTDEGDLVLDFCLGSGTSAATAQKMGRRWIGVELSSYFLDKPVARMKNVILGEQRGVSNQFDWRGGGSFKAFALESYEDALNNLPSPDGKLFEAMDEATRNSLVTYSLDLELGPHLLNMDAFEDPWGYQIYSQLAGEDEVSLHNVDMVETFNYLIGLKVHAYGPIERYNADFVQLPHGDDTDGEGNPIPEEKRQGKVRVEGRLRRDAEGPFVYQRIEGELNDGNATRVLVIWRKLTEDPDQDAAVLEAWMARHRETTKERSEHRDYHLIYINGPITLPQPTQELRTVLPTEQTFKDRMFDDTEV